ncbi:MAG TPA: gliding motility-associated ABC transporter substrate-binding protein GldG [Ferruginibacter sp.]|jgi:ABC-2 type transport system permease protein|nr:gliding motility-associated ABC transporter substrate-binding protein GldG [Ferruginibacter sp.]
MNFSKKIFKTKLWLPITIVLLVLLNWLASAWHTRIDFTNEKRFTLSRPTKILLRNLDDEVEIDVCLKGDLPSGFKKLANSTDELLQEFNEATGKNLTYHFVSPDDDVDGSSETYADTLAAMGAYPINLKSQLKAGEQQQYIYPLALVHYKGNVVPVNLYSGNKMFISFEELNSAEALMEYEFASAINKLTQTTKPLVAYAIGNGESVEDNTYDLQITTRQNYNLFQFNLNTQPAIPDTFKLLMIVKPKQPFSAEEKLKIDQYVMRGGKLLLFEDKLEAEMDSLQIKNEVIAYDRGLNLDDLLFRYGVRINSDLIMDLQCDVLPFDTNGNGQYEWLSWNYFPVFQTKANPVTSKNIYVAGRFVNSIDTVEADGIQKTVLLSSSANSRTIATPALISGKENVNAPEDDKFKKAAIPAAILLEGKFESVYNNHLSQQMRDSLAAYGGTFMSQCTDDNKMIIVSDGDMVLNDKDKTGQPIPMGMNPYTYGTQKEFPFANKDFFQNCLDYLVNQSGLSEAKAKDYTLRLLDPVKLEDERMEWEIGNIIGPILLVLLFGSIYQWWRKRRYTNTNG